MVRSATRASTTYQMPDAHSVAPLLGRTMNSGPIDVLVAAPDIAPKLECISYLRLQGFGVATSSPEEISKYARIHRFSAFVIAASETTVLTSCCRELRHQMRSTVPVIAISPCAALSSKLAAFEAGADDYLVEPASPIELELRLRNKVLRQARRSPVLVLRAGELVLDLQTHVARCHGAQTHLMPQEFRLLCALMRAAPEPLSRQAMMSELWSKGPPPSRDVSLRNLVCRLRGMLRRHGVRLALETLPDYACQLVPDPRTSQRS